MALLQLSRLLPLPEGDLQQVLDYASTLSKQEAVHHFHNLLGDEPAAFAFVSSFNSSRKDPKGPSEAAASQSTKPSSRAGQVPRAAKYGKNKKGNGGPSHTAEPRQVADLGPAPGTAYDTRHAQDEYPSPGPSSAALASKIAVPAGPEKATMSKPIRTAGGYLISDMTKSKPRSNPTSRSSTPGPKTKVAITGGTAMHGASTALADLDAAIKALELATRHTDSTDETARRCNCVAARHPLLTAAPNCTSCGKVICVKEGLGPCTFCGTPILSAEDVHSMIRHLKADRGQERQAADRKANRKADVSRMPAPFTQARESMEDRDQGLAESQALQHRDRLLAFQAQNAQRTTVRDEVADFDVSAAVAGTGGNIWASPEERARELKRQQKVMRDMEWNARPDYEKRRQVISIDLVAGKAIRKMAAIQRPPSPAANLGNAHDDETDSQQQARKEGGGGAFSRNPLLRGLIKPVFEPERNGTASGSELEGRKDRRTGWRKVQDDLDNNEAVMLDGGLYG